MIARTMPPLSPTEWLNDTLTHAAKSGPTLRSQSNDALTALGALIPKQHRGMPVEYDINYESPPGEIRGYKFTDLLTRCVWLSPCNSLLLIDHLAAVVDRGPTEEGVRIVEQLALEAEDKYAQRRAGDTVQELVVLPGSNLLARGVVNFDRIDQLVAHGAWIKPHPITMKLDLRRLERRYKDQLLPHTQQLYPTLRAAERVHFCTSSEAGLMAGLLGKPFGIIDKPGVTLGATYAALYRAMDQARRPQSIRQKLAALFSYPESGLFTVYHTNVSHGLACFFHQYARYPHRRPECSP